MVVVCDLVIIGSLLRKLKSITLPLKCTCCSQARRVLMYNVFVSFLNLIYFM